MLDPSRIGRWFLPVFLLIPGLTLLAAGIVELFGLSGQTVGSGFLSESIDQPAALLTSAAFVLILGPLPEELGWRGFALDRLQERSNALVASIALAALWSSWHVPLFFMDGYYRDARPNPALFVAGIVTMSILITWVYNNTSRSVLSAVLLHFVDNFTGELLNPSTSVRVVRTLLAATVIAAIVWRYGPGTLSRS